MKNNHDRHSNKITSTLCYKTIAVCAVLSLLAACGQRGALYIPTAPEATQRGTIVDTLIKPTTSSTNATNTPSANSAPAK